MTTQCSCGWPFFSPAKTTMQCPQCQSLVVVEPIDATAAVEVESIQIVANCKHIGTSLKASCGCGGLHWCNRLSKVCGQAAPFDEFVDITLPSGEVRLIGEIGFQTCRKCDHFELVTHKREAN